MLCYHSCYRNINGSSMNHVSISSCRFDISKYGCESNIYSFARCGTVCRVIIRAVEVPTRRPWNMSWYQSAEFAYASKEWIGIEGFCICQVRHGISCNHSNCRTTNASSMKHVFSSICRFDISKNWLQSNIYASARAARHVVFAFELSKYQHAVKKTYLEINLKIKYMQILIGMNWSTLWHSRHGMSC